MASCPGCWIEVKNYKIKGLGKKVKLLVLRLRRYEIPLSKQNLLKAVFPNSYKKLPKNPKSAYAGKVRAALRNEIRPQILEFRQTIPWPVICPLTNKRIWTWEGGEVDHQIPLVQLADQFVEQEGLKYSEIKLMGTVNSKLLKDVELAARWQIYHRDNAILNLVDSQANRKKGAGGYRPRDDLL